MATYENRLLWRQTKTGENGQLVALESTWAYTIQIADTTPLPGRYRIRVLNVEYIDPDNMTSVGVQLISLLEKWTADGWIECIDYMSPPPTMDFYDIESELNSMFKSFTTGVEMNKDYNSYIPDPPPSPNKPEKKTTTQSVSKPPPNEPDFDWI